MPRLKETIRLDLSEQLQVTAFITANSTDGRANKSDMVLAQEFQAFKVNTTHVMSCRKALGIMSSSNRQTKTAVGNGTSSSNVLLTKMLKRVAELERRITKLENDLY